MRISVALDVPLRQLFDYLPKPGEPVPKPGSRVKVPFGRRTLCGVVWDTNPSPNLAVSQLKTVRENIDEAPLFHDRDRKLIDFAARYYHQPIGEVVMAALPPLLRQGGMVDPTIERITITAIGLDKLAGDLTKRAPRQQALLEVLAAEQQGLNAEALQQRMPGWRQVGKPLIKQGAIHSERIEKRERWRLAAPRSDKPHLSDEQAKAVEAIESFDDGFRCWLLDGVTGSGKTEVFLRLIERQIERNQQTLLLVPEIGLTPQMVRRLEARLGVRVALLHSELSDLDRATAWVAAATGEALVVVGTRSSVFAPMANTGLIIVDEEHDPSLKQHEGFRYHARDLAIFRAADANIPVILGSATPSLETLANAQDGKYGHLRLTQRAAGARPPKVTVVDTNRFNLQDGLSQPVITAIQSHLDDGHQVLIYLNRRGYAPTLICTDCGTIARCQHCDANMTVHASRGQLQCHHCGARRALPTACETCHEPVRPLGEGTERVEQTLANLIPEYPLARIDSDTTSARGAMDKALAAAKSGESKLLIGTQMLAKGHHLPDLTLVVILNADQGFFASDFRASERLAQTIVQVSGRAGRGQRAGEVLIQTAYPEHRWLKTLVNEGYHALAATILQERQLAGWPPYTAIAVLHAASKQESAAIEFLNQAKATLVPFGIHALGPAPASMLRRQGRYRYQLLLTADSRQSLQSQLLRLTDFLATHKPPHHLRWSLDVDPQSEL
ncbi:MAG: primosomal protein N' [Pseudomonadota bacterium]